MVLVDTNVWVDFLNHSQSQKTDPLETLALEKQVALTSLIRAELLSGAKTPADYATLGILLSTLPILQETPDLWERAAHARFLLKRQGHQAALIDLSIAELARAHDCLLWTFDRQFEVIQKVISFKRFK